MQIQVQRPSTSEGWEKKPPNNHARTAEEDARWKKKRESQFWKKVDKKSNSDCWLWTASRNAFGYGIISGMRAHRMAWILFVGDIPEKMCVLHKCDNPSCVNPHHLFIGTYADNNRDKMLKGRARGGVGKGELSSRKKLTKSQVYEILISTSPQKEIARRFNVSQSTISLIKTYKTWK